MNAYSTANLALVAYAEVDGATGASTATNSGVTTTRTSTGVYLVALPSVLTQFSARDLIFVQPKSTAALGVSNVPSALVNDIPTATKIVYIGDSTTTAVDCSFSIVILRTLVPPPTGAPA